MNIKKVIVDSAWIAWKDLLEFSRSRMRLFMLIFQSKTINTNMGMDGLQKHSFLVLKGHLEKHQERRV